MAVLSISVNMHFDNEIDTLFSADGGSVNTSPIGGGLTECLPFSFFSCVLVLECFADLMIVSSDTMTLKCFWPAFDDFFDPFNDCFFWV